MPALAVATRAAERRVCPVRGSAPLRSECWASLARCPTGTEDGQGGETRPGVLKDPEPQLVDGDLVVRAAGAPSVATPLLAAPAADGVDSSSLRFLTPSALAARRKEEKEKEQEKSVGAVVAGSPLVAAGAWGAPLAPANEQDPGTLAAQGGYALGLVFIVQEEKEEKEEVAEGILSFLSPLEIWTLFTGSCLWPARCLLLQWIHVHTSVSEVFTLFATRLTGGLFGLSVARGVLVMRIFWRVCLPELFPYSSAWFHSGHALMCQCLELVDDFSTCPSPAGVCLA